MTEFNWTMEGVVEDRAAWDKLFETAAKPVIQQLRDAEEKYILDFFGSVENVLKYGKDYYIEYSPMEAKFGDDDHYHVSQTMRMKRKEIHP